MKRGRIRIQAGFLAVLCLGLCMCAMPVQAAKVDSGGSQVTSLTKDTDMSYSGPISELEEGSRKKEESQSPIVMLAQGISAYDKEKGSYINYVDSKMQRSYYSSVPNGITTNQGVSVTIGEGLNSVLYKNGEEVSNADLTMIEEEGAYVLKVSDGNGLNQSQFTFRILYQVTNKLSAFETPNGFTLTSVTLNGEGISIDSQNQQKLGEDGNYSFTFECAAIGIAYTTSLELDREAPELGITGVEKGIAHGPVIIENLDSNNTIEVLLNEEEYPMSFMNQLTEHGQYVVTVTDLAGNSSSYDFVIQVYLTISSISVLLMAAAIIAGLAGYSIRTRRHVRIR